MYTYFYAILQIRMVLLEKQKQELRKKAKKIDRQKKHETSMTYFPVSYAEMSFLDFNESDYLCFNRLRNFVCFTVSISNNPKSFVSFLQSHPHANFEDFLEWYLDAL